MKEVKKNRPGYNFNLRLGYDDVAVFEKDYGGFYRSVPLGAVIDTSDLPCLTQTETTPIGRERYRVGEKRENSSPEHSMAAEDKRTKRDEDEGKIADVDGGEPTIDEDDLESEAVGGEGRSLEKSKENKEDKREKNDTTQQKDGD